MAGVAVPSPSGLLKFTIVRLSVVGLDAVLSILVPGADGSSLNSSLRVMPENCMVMGLLGKTKTVPERRTS